MDTEKNSRRPVIGVMTGSFHTDFSRQVTEAICRHLKDANMDACLFQGLDASRFLKIEGYVDKSFDDHYYSQFEYSRFIRPDLIIASVSTISAVPNPLSAAEFRYILPDVPMIALEVEDEIPNGVHIFLDNYKGMSDCVEHLITAHGCRTICFVSGPRGVADAEKRLSAYRDTMRAHGIAVTDDMIVYGDFTDHVDPLVEKLLAAHPRPDAIVCGNDEMAESACRVLRLHGLRPGADVAVTGFDDNAAARQMDPPLTTVCQSKELIARKAVEIIQAYLRGEQPSSVILPTELVVRSSCGCLEKGGRDHAHPDPEQRSLVIEDRQIIKRLYHESILTSLMLRNLLNQNITVHSFFRKLGNVLHLLNTGYSWIALLDEPQTVPESSRFHVPDRLRLHMLQKGSEISAWSDADAPALTPDDPAMAASLRPHFDDDEHIAVFPLFHGSTHYGVFGVKVSFDSMVFYYTLSLQIGTGLEYLFMALDEQAARAALEEKNQILDFSASHDGLTGLYNRVGVMKQIYDYIRHGGPNERFVAVMADLDHLKQINDVFGHETGDRALRKAAEILSSALPEGAPLGRCGGDEFMAVFRAESDETAENFYRSVKDACRAYNALREAPFYEEISVGYYPFVPQKGMDILECFSKADERLYADKKNRKENVVRDNG